MTNLGLAGVIAAHAQRTPHKTALHFAGENTSYQQLWQRIEAATGALAEHGVKPGDRVAWRGLNDPLQLVVLFAVARLGAILLPLNYRLADAEIDAILVHAGASLVVDAGWAKKQLDSPVSSLGGLELAGTAASPVLLVYTSGTTGKPKGALHTQAGLIANCVISADAHAFSSDDHVLTALPLFHVGGLCIQTLPGLYVGATVTLHARFDAGAWLSDVHARRPSLSVLVPATLRAVIDHPNFAETDLSSLRLLNAGSSTIPLSQIEAFHARGVPVCQVYGATETGPVSIYLKRDDAIKNAGSAGKAGLNVDVRLVEARLDDANADPTRDAARGQASTSQDVPLGAVGELWIRAPNLMCRYWNDPTNPAFHDGWFRTGDLARCDDDGFYWVVGRSKDMIISGGENIYPAEIENLLADCPLILEAAVIGLPDEKWGEVPVAVVVKVPGSALDEAGVMKLLDGKLARFKHPRRALFFESLPKTALGKIQKSELNALIATHLR